MPQVKKGEKQSEYISRCVKEVMGEGMDQKAALGKCYGMWKQHEKKSKGEMLIEGMSEQLKKNE